MKFNLEVKGIDQIQRVLKSLPQSVNDKVMYDVFRGAATRVVKPEIERSTPSGNNTKRSKNKAENNVIVARQKGTKNGVSVGYRRRAFHILFIQKGTTNRKLRGTGKYRKGTTRGKIVPRNFLEPAHDRAFSSAMNYVTTNYLSIINRSIRKQLRNLKTR